MAEDLVELTIDGIPIAVPKGTLIVEAAKQAGVDIPAVQSSARLPDL